MDRLDALRAETSKALEASIIESEQRQQATESLFRCDLDAPYALAIKTLTGLDAPEDAAPTIWRHSLEIQYRWSSRLKEAVTLRTAVMEALSRREEEDSDGAEEPASLDAYLERDTVTGLYNEAHYQKRLARELESSRKTGQPLTLTVLSIEGLQALKDTRAPSDYEDLLRKLGEKIRYHFRPTDLPCRSESNEIRIILPGTAVSSAVPSVEALTVQLREMPGTADLTVLAGLASFPEDGTTAKAVERAAELALRRARTVPGGVANYSHGRGKVHTGQAEEERRWPAALAVAALIAAGAGVVVFARPHEPAAQTPESAPATSRASFTAAVPAPSAAAGPSTVSSTNPAPQGIPSHMIRATAYPATRGGPQGSARALASGAPSVQDQAEETFSPGWLEHAGQQRVTGGYALAEHRLGAEASGRSGLDRLEALLASACAASASGADTSRMLHGSALLAKSLRGHDQRVALQLLDLVRGRLSRSSGDRAGAMRLFRSAVWLGGDNRVTREATADLVALEAEMGNWWGAGQTARSATSAESSPPVVAAFSLLGSGTTGQSREAIDLLSAQPALLNLPDPLGGAAASAAARALIPSTRSIGPDDSASPARRLLSPGVLPDGAALRLKVALAKRLLEADRPKEVHSLLAALAHALRSGGASQRPDSSESLTAEILTLDGVALWASGNEQDARSEWAVAARTPADRPALWDPAPVETYWAKLASGLLDEQAVRPAVAAAQRQGRSEFNFARWLLELPNRSWWRPGPDFQTILSPRPTLRKPFRRPFTRYSPEYGNRTGV